jgi:Fur family transcriptional regulator, ferric uptake regulator
VSRVNQDVSAQVHEAVGARLLGVGQRYTGKRRALVDALLRAGNPVPISDLADPRSGLPQSSVYRNLGVLEHAGAVRRVLTEEESGRYEIAEDLTEHHHHLVCRSCGAVEDVSVPKDLERAMQRAVADLADRTGYVTLSHRLDMIGTCRRCR